MSANTMPASPDQTPILGNLPEASKPVVAGESSTTEGSKKASGKKRKSKNDESKRRASASEKLEGEATLLFMRIRFVITKHDGKYLRDDAGTYHLLLGGMRVPLNYDKNNYLLGALLLDTVQMTIHSPVTKPLVARLIDDAHRSTTKFKLKRFSAMSEDGTRLYIPVGNHTKLLRVTADGVGTVPNGDNEDSIWLEHPQDSGLKQLPPADPKAALGDLQRLAIDTQATKVPEMRWLVAMNEGFFPFMRDLFPARFLLSHIGGSQHGKTSGAQRFTLLHGLGEVKGDYSVASLGNLPDLGLLVLDNREQANLDQKMIDYLLFLATGAQRGRSDSDGSIRVSGSRPVAVITSIEGFHKKELKTRNVEVEYVVSGGPLPRAAIESEIKLRRQEMLAATVPVIQKYLEINKRNLPTPNPIPPFEEHFTALCNLLRAFGEVMGWEASESERIIEVWNRTISGREPEEDELEQPIMEILRDAQTALPADVLGPGTSLLDGNVHVYAGIKHDGKSGKLYVTSASELLFKLQALGPSEQNLPRNAQGLGRRLRDGKFQRFVFLDEERRKDIQQLKRTQRYRPIGFFIPD